LDSKIISFALKPAELKQLPAGNTALDVNDRITNNFKELRTRKIQIAQ
jgi:hypothetical protein